MAIKLLLSMLVCIAIGACSSEYEKVGVPQAKGESTQLRSVSKISVHGVLSYFPQSVESSAAWLGHEFMVGDTPIRPATAVPTEKLKDLVGETVSIEGVWNPGREWKPPNEEDEEFRSQRPLFPEGEVVIRGAGIEASKIMRANE